VTNTRFVNYSLYDMTRRPGRSEAQTRDPFLTTKIITMQKWTPDQVRGDDERILEFYIFRLNADGGRAYRSRKAALKRRRLENPD